MKTLLKIFLAVISTTTLAAEQPVATTVDVYGTKQLTSQQVVSIYSKEIQTIASNIQSGVITAPKQDQSDYLFAMNKMNTNIKLKGQFAYVNISPIIYPNDPITHITIDVVEKTDKQRLSYFLPKPTQSISDPHHLIRYWQQYEQAGFSIVFKEKKFPDTKNCPAYHCLFGFDHPLLQKYQNTFELAEKYKHSLVRILRHDKDENKRAAAAYVLAHIKSKKELAKLLLPSINDSSSLVRNNTMRVIGAIASDDEVNIPINNIVKALDFPSTTDRNKALYILSTLANKTENINHIKQHSGSYLIATLKLQQPNNHEFSYAILKKISGKNYSDRDYKAWETWLEANHA